MEDDYKSLEEQINDLCKTTDFLAHRLDSIQRLLDQNTFELETQKIGATAENVRELLAALKLEEPLELGEFLRALNKYLIHNDLVDLNDLQIYLNPLLAAAFQTPADLKKIPYALLLSALPKMFVSVH